MRSPQSRKARATSKPETMQGQAVVCAQQRRETSAGSQAVKVSGLGGEITIAGDRFGRHSFCPFVRRLFWAPRLRRPACVPLPATLELHTAQNKSVNVAVLHVTPPHHPCCQPTPSNVSCATTAPQPQPRLSTSTGHKRPEQASASQPFRGLQARALQPGPTIQHRASHQLRWQRRPQPQTTTTTTASSIKHHNKQARSKQPKICIQLQPAARDAHVLQAQRADCELQIRALALLIAEEGRVQRSGAHAHLSKHEH